MFNKIQILGTMTRDLELRYTQAGTAIGNFGIAVNETWVKDGQKSEKAHFFDVSAFGKTAENINNYFRKGSRILIDGSLDFQTWEKDGQKHSKVSIKMSGFTFIDKKSGNDTNVTTNQQSYQQNQPQQNSYNQPQQPQAYQPPRPTYQDAQGNPTPPPAQQYQQPQQQQTPPAIDIDESEVPF